MTSLTQRLKAFQAGASLMLNAPRKPHKLAADREVSPAPNTAYGGAAAELAGWLEVGTPSLKWARVAGLRLSYHELHGSNLCN